MKNIGLFAGAFDPIHLGHIHFINQAIKKSELDKVYLLIEREPKYKESVADYEHRRRMVELATAQNPKIELYDSKSPFFPISSSLPEISQANPGVNIFLLLGQDVADHIHGWEGADKLLKNVNLIIAPRGEEGAYSQMSSFKIKQELKKSKTPAGLDRLVLDYCRQNGIYASKT